MPTSKTDAKHPKQLLKKKRKKKEKARKYYTQVEETPTAWDLRAVS